MSKNYVLIKLFIFFLCAFQTQSFALTVEEAYQAIPHRRTAFSPNRAAMTSEERTYLTELYQLVDLAIVERVGMLLYLTTFGEKGQLATRYDAILKELRALKPPAKLSQAQALIISAIEEQRAFLGVWYESAYGSMVKIPTDPRVRRASAALKKAYGIFQQAFPNEGTHNQQAFFDYLCALDFI